MNKKMHRFSISSSQVDVVHTKHVFTVHVQAMAAGALPTAGGTSRLAADEICTLCSRLHCDNTRLDNTLEHCRRHRTTLDEPPALLLPRPSSAIAGATEHCAELHDGGDEVDDLERGSVTRVAGRPPELPRTRCGRLRPTWGAATIHLIPAAIGSRALTPGLSRG